MLQCEKHMMKNKSQQGWTSNFHHHIQVLQSRNYFNWIFFFFFTHKAIKIEKTNILGHVLKGVFNTSGVNLPIPNYFKLLWSELLPDEEDNGKQQKYHVSTTLRKKSDSFSLKNTQKQCLETHFVLIYSSNFCQQGKDKHKPIISLGKVTELSFLRWWKIREKQ